MPPSKEPVLQLRKALEHTIREGHPWVYREAVSGNAAPGEITTLVGSDGGFVARGIADGGPIALRVVTTRDETVALPLFSDRIARAAELRSRVLPAETNAYRLLNGEGDRLPGFVCDVYGEFAVLKTDGAGAAAWRDTAVAALRPVLDARGVRTLLARASGRTGRSGGGDEEPKSTLLYGDAPPGRLIVREHGMALVVDLAHGQKTGLFLDQRESRARVQSMAHGLRVLNLYGYTGGFSVAAGIGGAVQVETVDVSPGAIEMADASWAANTLDAARHRGVTADVPVFLGERARARARYDLVIADPPSFAPREDSVAGALKSYRTLHSSCLALINNGGFYLAASCSSHVTRAAFADSVLDGARRAKRTLQWIDAWGAPADHPRMAAFPEGDYLKVNLYRVLD